MTGSAAGESGSTLVLATRNEGKLREMQQLVAQAGLQDVTVVSVAQFPDVEDVRETGVTFEENSRLKAHAVARATHLPAVSDDSGLAVDVLGGCPGVFSARWAGRHGADQANIDLLLAQTADVDADRLTARFVCCATLALPDGREVVHTGELHGHLTRHARGDNGFGYDPIFLLPDGRTLAELTDQEKNAISHRGQALRALTPDLGTMVG